MNYDKLKERMDAFFENVDPSELINDLEELGYEFEPCLESFKFGMGNANILHSDCIPSNPIIDGMDSLQGYTMSDQYAAAA